MAGEGSLGESAPPKDVDLRHLYMGIIIAVTVVSIVIAWLRVYTRVFISRNPGWDDWIMLMSTPITLITNGFLLRAFQLGLGRHQHYVPKAQIPECFKWLWAAEPTNLFALYAVRVSIALFFLRLIPQHQKGYRRIIWISIWALTLSDVYVSITYFIQCIPIEKVWLPDTPGKCLPNAAYEAAPWVYQAVSILADIALVSIPLLMFRTLNLPKRTKIGVIVLCCLGVFTCAIAIAKTALLPALFDHEEKDKTWSLAQLCFWAPMEICIGMICGCVPCLKPLYHRIRGNKPPGSHLPSSYATGSQGGTAFRAKGTKYGVRVTANRDDRSKSEESILRDGAADIELGTVGSTGLGSDGRDSPGFSGATAVGGGAAPLSRSNTNTGTMGILRTTQVEFRNEPLKAS
ncbi:hypothetical protein CC80DRAFT_555232 [Byssothecium circinans]|uniref:Rhodopsin domain-containing protein n=1 Tax=Byssothecium circinans TaxID=147558 RepID=A0A6A5TB58_9PLEO|nr:hypothetical protein CC80DRAFT_555232 [Byssothecium circinans]